ncbi:SURF1 family protein [Pseudohongiella spirulinae]|uniref:SURF1 family protein n=1 Tax=Pseudohongiella spirulinae TaxID=1249552 RepID=UPI0012E3AD65|nr:SURF1 family protein [Pseudohongiella spirulinae]
MLITLGMWQLDREQQKIDLQRRYELRQQQEPLGIDRVDWRSNDLAWLRVEASGYFEQRQQFLLDNKIYDSRVGYEVITPFRTDYGTLLVNRGWIQQGPSRQILPAIPTPEGRQLINIHIFAPEAELMMLAEDNLEDTNWPKVVQRIDIEKMSAALGEGLLPYSARLEQGAAGLLQYNWQAINTRPETHRGYAIQWFIMALVLVILYLTFSFRRSEN